MNDSRPPCELRSAVADEERLLRELRHRVKNNLQTVTSLVRLQERRTRSVEARRELRSVGRRIETLGLAHEKLHATGRSSAWASAPTSGSSGRARWRPRSSTE